VPLRLEVVEGDSTGGSRRVAMGADSTPSNHTEAVVAPVVVEADSTPSNHTVAREADSTPSNHTEAVVPVVVAEEEAPVAVSVAEEWETQGPPECNDIP
jgi:hypothetical protein